MGPTFLGGCAPNRSDTPFCDPVGSWLVSVAALETEMAAKRKGSQAAVSPTEEGKRERDQPDHASFRDRVQRVVRQVLRGVGRDGTRKVLYEKVFWKVQAVLKNSLYEKHEISESTSDFARRFRKSGISKISKGTVLLTLTRGERWRDITHLGLHLHRPLLWSVSRRSEASGRNSQSTAEQAIGSLMVLWCVSLVHGLCVYGRAGAWREQHL